MARDRYGEPIEDEGDVAPASTQREKRSHASTRGGPRLPTWERVPAGTNPSICGGHRKPGGSCRAEIFWIERPKMRQGRPVPGVTVRVPVDCEVDGGQRPDSFTEGKGVTHYSTCPDAEQF